MNFLEKARNYVANPFPNWNPTAVVKDVSMWDIYLEDVLSILSWKSKQRTLRVFFVTNTLMWGMLTLNVKLYGILAVIGLCLFLYDMGWRQTMYSKFKGEYSDMIQNFCNTFTKITDILKDLRKNSPVMFSSCMALFFLALQCISSSLPGRILIYLLFLLTFSLPLCFKMLPEHVVIKMRTIIATLSTPKCVLAEDELIPFIQGKDFGKCDADLESLLTDRTADSVTNSLVSGISTMPSYLEIAESACDIEEEDLLPRAGLQGVSFTPGELSSDSDSDHREIRFDSDHFNTSSSDEDPYSKNLSFPKDVQDSSKDKAGIRKIITNVITSVSGNLVSNMFQSVVNKTPVKTTITESDSEFEFVEREDISDDFSSRN